ncbi:MAG: UDP-N-acetylmuramoyl-L-alanyl-D-glutamate--2,6-diaminopimelate ligase [Candidatus Omnitrophota bacterium]
MLLKDLLENIYTNPIPEKYQSLQISSVDCDSRKVKPGSLFVALKGTKSDGIQYVQQALENGASCVVKSPDHVIDFSVNSACLLEVSDTKAFLKSLALRFYQDPSRVVQCIGITGTNGKTTTTYLVESILRAASRPCGVIGTINCHFGSRIIKIQNTTPSLVDICDYLSQMHSEGFNYCAMEVSSHALDQGRAEAVDFKVGVFTNLTQDHLDYHKDMEDYFLAKTKLFAMLSKASTAVLNIDDFYGKRLTEKTSANILSYGIKEKADVFATKINLGLEKTSFVLTMQQDECAIETSLIGMHNIYNILAACAACRALGIDLEHIREGIENMHCVPGRLEPVDCGQKFSVFVDYAHTDDALKNVLESIRAIKKSKIILVFGCGGDRDKEKRAKMGKVASELADFSIITNDNPRSENPEDIVNKIVTGFTHDHYFIILDRKEAIMRALGMAKGGDVVLIAGKGHENYQILKNEKIDFDDRQIVREILSC